MPYPEPDIPESDKLAPNNSRSPPGLARVEVVYGGSFRVRAAKLPAFGGVPLGKPRYLVRYANSGIESQHAASILCSPRSPGKT